MRKYTLKEINAHKSLEEQERDNKWATLEELKYLCDEFEIAMSPSLGEFLMDKMPSSKYGLAKGFVLESYGRLVRALNDYRHHIDTLAINPCEYNAMVEWMGNNGYNFKENKDYIIEKKEKLVKPHKVKHSDRGFVWYEWDDGVRTTYEGYTDDFYNEVFLKRDK